MFERIKQWFRREAPSEEPQPAHKVGRLYATPDPKGAPNTRVYHEYFVPEAPEDGSWPWTCRVYGPGGTYTDAAGQVLPKPPQIMLQRGKAPTERLAREQAIAWAEQTKAAVRRAQ